MIHRKYIYFLGIVAIISLLLNVYFAYKLFYSASPAQQNNKTNIVLHKVTRVIDGDTFDLENEERIRMYGINAPEYPKGCMSEDAKNRLEMLLLNKKVRIQQITKDNFGRLVSLVYFDDLFVNEIMVEEGYAYFEKSKPEREATFILEKVERKAKQTLRGVWSSPCVTKQEGCVIKGNYRSADHTRLYHTPDCYNYDRITVKPGTTDRWFCSEKEAQAAGFRKSLDCPPQ